MTMRLNAFYDVKLGLLLNEKRSTTEWRDSEATGVMKMKKEELNGLRFLFDGKGRLCQTWLDPPPFSIPPF